MISFSSKYRSNQDEILDDLQLHGDELGVLLSDLKRVNAILGGNSITINGLAMLLKDIHTSTSIKVVDIGCGDGEQLRQLAHYAKKNKRNLHLVGVDANKFIIEEAKARSKDFPEIEYQVFNVFKLNETKLVYDIAICTLFLHHFKSNEITSMLQTISERAKVGVIINDLDRSRLAFEAFKAFSAVFLKSKIAKHDGLVSIARGFKKPELASILSQVPQTTYHLCWKWAFRWQAIIKKNKIN